MLVLILFVDNVKQKQQQQDQQDVDSRTQTTIIPKIMIQMMRFVKV
jgi:hypothetical protein